MKKVIFNLVFCSAVLFINQPVFAQADRWQLVARNDNGSTSYLDTTNLRKSGDRIQTWVKDVYRDGSYKITQIDWRCREKKFRVLEATNYEPSGQFLDREETSVWVAVVPDSVSEKYYRMVCVSTGQINTEAESNSSDSKLIAQVIVRNANIRESPTANSRVLQTVAKGRKLLLADTERSDGWYQVIVPRTNATGWLHGNTIKLFKVTEKNKKKQRLRK